MAELVTNNYIYIFLLFCFYTGEVQLSFCWSSTLVLLGLLGHLMWGGHPNVQFRCCTTGTRTPIAAILTTSTGAYIVNARGGSRGGGSWGSGPPPFGGPPNFIKREKTSRACARKRRILVLNSYPDPPLSEILYPPLNAIVLRLPGQGVSRSLVSRSSPYMDSGSEYCRFKSHACLTQ